MKNVMLWIGILVGGAALNAGADTLPAADITQKNLETCRALESAIRETTLLATNFQAQGDSRAAAYSAVKSSLSTEFTALSCAQNFQQEADAQAAAETKANKCQSLAELRSTNDEKLQRLRRKGRAFLASKRGRDLKKAATARIDDIDSQTSALGCI